MKRHLSRSCASLSLSLPVNIRHRTVASALRDFQLSEPCYEDRVFCKLTQCRGRVVGDIRNNTCNDTTSLPRTLEFSSPVSLSWFSNKKIIYNSSSPQQTSRQRRPSQQNLGESARRNLACSRVSLSFILRHTMFRELEERKHSASEAQKM